MGNHTLFIYGTLLDDTRRFEIFGRELAVVPEAIAGFGRSHVIDLDGTQYPTVVPGGDGIIVGGLLIDLTHEDLRLGDEYETRLYVRQTVRTLNDRAAWVYIGYPESHWW